MGITVAMENVKTGFGNKTKQHSAPRKIKIETYSIQEKNGFGLFKPYGHSAGGLQYMYLQSIAMNCTAMICWTIEVNFDGDGEDPRPTSARRLLRMRRAVDGHRWLTVAWTSTWKGRA